MKKVSRRNLLRGAAVLGGATLAEPLLRPALVFGASAVNPDAPGQFFVEVKLHGGHDGLYLFPPSGGAEFAALKVIRPQLMGQSGFSAPTDVRTVSGSPLGVHPLMSNAPSGGVSVHSLLASGQGRVISRIAPRLQNRSHEVAQNYWLSGDMYGTPSASTHWLARLMDEHSTSLSATQVWRLGDVSGFAFARSNGDYPMTLESLDRFSLNNRGVAFGGDAEARMAETAAKDLLGLQTDLQPHEEELRSALQQAYAGELAARPIAAFSAQPFCGSGIPNPCYPYDRFGMRFREAAKILRYYASRGTTERVYIQLNFGNFDTHGAEIEALNGFMPFFTSALSTFIADLGGTGSQSWARTAVYVSSEFGRTLYQNAPTVGSGPGTEHGYGNIAGLFSGGLNQSRGPFVGGEPSMAEYSASGTEVLGMSVDMVQVYWEILSWMGFNPQPVFPEYTQGAGPGRAPLRLFI